MGFQKTLHSPLNPETCIQGFGMPVKVKWGNEEKWIRATEAWATISGNNNGSNFSVDNNFYINSKNVN